MKKIFCIGELLIDFIGQTGQGIVRSSQFSKLAGGAPANVAASITKLGGKAAFLGQVGADSFGTFLLATLNELGVDIALCTQAGKTTLAFVALDRNGERDFEFYRGSDGDYQLPDLDLTQHIANNDIIHFGSATALLGGKLRTSYFQMLEFADSNGNFISFDPNFREDLVTPDLLANYIHDCKTFISYADMAKLSESEAQLISGEDDLNKAATYLQYVGAKNVIITLGAKGAILCNSNGSRIIPSRAIQAVDATGAGDAFVGGLLFKIAQHVEPSWDSFVAFANLVGAFTCTNYGAIRAMPTMRQFLEFIN